MLKITSFSPRLMIVLLAGCIPLAGCVAELGEDEASFDEEVGLAEEALVAGGFMVRNTNTGKCLTVASSSGSDAYLTTCSSTSDSQRWGFDGGLLKHTLSGLCLDLEAASQNNGAPVQVFGCTGGLNQDFRFYPRSSHPGTTVTNWHLVVRHSGKCIEQGGATGTQVVQGNSCLSAWNVVF